jgi:hypothetical protein
MSKVRGGRLVTEDRLRFWTAPSTTVLVTTPLGAFKLFKIMFGEDGSIYVPFPYLDTKRGILTEADPATEADPKTLQLRRNGVVVDYDVKFAHHASGIVHFSKSGEKDLLPRLRSISVALRIRERDGLGSPTGSLGRDPSGHRPCRARL